MQVIMNCRECQREMGLAEFLTYAEFYLIKTLIVPVVIPFLISAIKSKLATESRGIINSSMAGLANNFLIACPKCKKVECWDPTQKQKPQKLKQKNENAQV